MNKNLNRFYTYAYLREDRTPYYIGKGCGFRITHPSRTVKKPSDKNRIIFLKKNLTEEEAFKHEIYMISIFGRKNIGTGILRNLSDGGEGSSGFKHSEETKIKLSQLRIGNKYSLNRKLSDETKEKIGNANKGNISYWRGKKLPKEMIEKQIITKNERGIGKGEKNGRAKTWKITFDNGEVEIVKSLQTWCVKNGYKATSVRNLYNGNSVKKHKNIIKVEQFN